MNRNHVWLVVLLSIVLSIVLTSCTPDPLLTGKDDLKQLGLYGEHVLRSTDRLTLTEGSLSGFHFFGIGSVDGKISSETKLEFCWGVNDTDRYFTTLPYERIKFIINNTYYTPTVEFVFIKWKENENVPMSHFHDPETTNLNDVIGHDYLNFAIIRLPQTIFDKEIRISD